MFLGMELLEYRRDSFLFALVLWMNPGFFKSDNDMAHGILFSWCFETSGVLAGMIPPFLVHRIASSATIQECSA